MLLPFLNDMTGMNLILDYSSPGIWLVIISIILLLGFGAGSYPAFYLSILAPARSGKRSLFATIGSFDFKEVLIVIQFALSIILIIGTSLIYRQVNYMKNMNTGISIKDKLIIELPEGMVNSGNREQVKEEFIGAGLFSGASVSSSVPGRRTYTWRLWPSGEERENTHPVNCIEVDHDFIDLYGLEIIAGQKFDKNLGEESNLGYIQNEAAVRAFGWGSTDEAMTKSINEREKLHGILRDFHYKGLQKEIEPFGMFCGDTEDGRYLTLQYEAAGFDSHRLALVEEKFYELFPGKIFRFFFLEQDFNLQYKSEDRLIRLFVAFTLVSVLIAVIGLFGMTAFYCVQKEKSMGIRKVFGAEPSVILTSLVKKFISWILISFIIAVPLAVIGIKMWLSNFAFRADISIPVILLAGLLSVIITVLTVLFHSLRLSGKNPVDIIRQD
jgi:putative ABC transport system permease protein